MSRTDPTVPIAERTLCAHDAGAQGSVGAYARSMGPPIRCGGNKIHNLHFYRYQKNLSGEAVSVRLCGGKSSLTAVNLFISVLRSGTCRGLHFILVLVTIRTRAALFSQKRFVLKVVPATFRSRLQKFTPSVQRCQQCRLTASRPSRQALRSTVELSEACLACWATVRTCQPLSRACTPRPLPVSCRGRYSAHALRHMRMR